MLTTHEVRLALGVFVLGGALAACQAPSAATQPLVDSPSPNGEPVPLPQPAPSNELGVPNAIARCAHPTALGVRLLGRFDDCAQGGVRLSWSGSGFAANFQGTTLEVTTSGPALRYAVTVDGASSQEFTTVKGRGTSVVVTGLSPGEHLVVVTRQGEAHLGASTIEALRVPDGTLLSVPPAPSKRLEIVGDSITAGYGNEGTSPNCPFTPETENHQLTYGALLARHFQAELSTIAWSGKGVVSNYGGDRDAPMPTLYDRAIATDPNSVWDFRSWQADAVLVNLGTNDYSTDHDPSDQDFVREYENLLARLRARYPNAFILCTIGPLLGGRDLPLAETNIQAALSQRAAAGDRRVAFHAMRVPNDSPGCDWHPGLGTHEAMARELEPVLAKLLGW